MSWGGYTSRRMQQRGDFAKKVVRTKRTKVDLPKHNIQNPQQGHHHPKTFAVNAKQSNKGEPDTLGREKGKHLGPKP